jgi:F-type H+-transporting ATPase subunit c
MEYAALKFLGVGLMAFGLLGAAIGVGNIFAAMLTAIARNPGAEEKLSRYVYIGAGLSEAMGLFALVIALLLIYAV